MINKLKVAKKIQKYFEEKVEEGNIRLGEARDRINETPACRIDDPDTTQIEQGYICHGREKCFADILDALHKIDSMIENMNGHHDELVTIGSMIRLAPSGQEDGGNYYFIIPKEGGVKVEVDGNQIMAVSVYAPIAQLMMGKEEGESIIHLGMEHDIKEVY